MRKSVKKINKKSNKKNKIVKRTRKQRRGRKVRTGGMKRKEADLYNEHGDIKPFDERFPEAESPYVRKKPRTQKKPTAFVTPDVPTSADKSQQGYKDIFNAFPQAPEETEDYTEETEDDKEWDKMQEQLKKQKRPRWSTLTDPQEPNDL